MALIGDFARAVGQMADRRFLWVLLKAVGLTLLLLAGLTWGAAQVASLIPTDLGNWWLFGHVELPASGVEGVAIGVMLIASVVLMIPVAAVFVGFFLEEIAAAVEARYYPGLPPAKALGIFASLMAAFRFFFVVLFANIVGIVLYLVSGPVAPLVFYAVNGYLLGREYFELVAARHLGFREAGLLRRRHWLRTWAAGTLMAIPLTIPILNLFVPVLGVATITHQFHRFWRPAAGQ